MKGKGNQESRLTARVNQYLNKLINSNFFSLKELSVLTKISYPTLLKKKQELKKKKLVSPEIKKIIEYFKTEKIFKSKYNFLNKKTTTN